MVSCDNMKCRATIKKSNKRGLWQIKEDNHDLVSLSSAHDLVQKCMFLSGIDTSDRRMAHWSTFSDEPFEGYQLKLEKKGGDFHIVDYPEFSGHGFFDPKMFKFYKSAPKQLYILIEKGNYNMNKHGVDVIE